MTKLARCYAPFPCFSETFDIFNWWLLWKNCCNEIIQQKLFEICRFWTFVEFPLTIWFNDVFLSGNETWEQTIPIIMDGHLYGAFLLKALHNHWLYEVYNTFTTFNNSHTHSHTLTNTLAALQGANLLIRSDTALFIQSTPKYFYTQPFTHTHTNGTAIGSNTRFSILPSTSSRSRGLNHRPQWTTNSTSWVLIYAIVNVLITLLKGIYLVKSVLLALLDCNEIGE